MASPDRIGGVAVRAKSKDYGYSQAQPSRLPPLPDGDGLALESRRG